MENIIEIPRVQIEKSPTSRLSEVDFDSIAFGKVYTDHMLVATYSKGKWSSAKIQPYGPITVSPAIPAIHYGQSIFEGMKAYKTSLGEINLFRPLDNWKRMNVSAQRMCMPEIPEDMFMEGLTTLIDLDRGWVPEIKGASLYIRPFLFSTDEYIGLKPFESFTFMIILSPVTTYYSAPVRVKIETHFTRAVTGGTGYAKTGGNYGGAIYPAMLAQKEGYHQLIWTDGKEHQYIEESGTMNIMFVINDKLVTPALTDSILAGITRESVLQLSRKWGVEVEERSVSVSEIVEALAKKEVQEVFGVGTAATIAHIEGIGYEGKNYDLPPVADRKLANRMLKELDEIKYGIEPDPFGWIVKV